MVNHELTRVGPQPSRAINRLRVIQMTDHASQALAGATVEEASPASGAAPLRLGRLWSAIDKQQRKPRRATEIRLSSVLHTMRAALVVVAQAALDDAPSDFVPG